MDDVTLAGHAETVAGDIEMFRYQGCEAGSTTESPELWTNQRKQQPFKRRISERLSSDGSNQL